MIRELDVDVIGLQEVESGKYTGGEPVQLERLAEVLSMAAVAGPTLFRGPADYGNALLTRFDILAVRHVNLSVLGREPRAALDVDLAGDDSLRVVVTHFGLRAAERATQARKLLDEVRGSASDGKRRLVVLGDFNEWMPVSRTLRSIEELLGRVRPLATFPAWRPLLALDRIWVRPSETTIARRVHATPLAKAASDHLPIVAELE